jgi:hypothetical protein
MKSNSLPYGGEDSDFALDGACAATPAVDFGWVRPSLASIAAKLPKNRMYGEFQPMALGSAKAPFSHPDWLFELKYDGFRALAHIDGKRTQLVSRNGHPFASFSDLGPGVVFTGSSDTDLSYSAILARPTHRWALRRRDLRAVGM